MEETTGKLKTGEGQAAPRPKRKYYPRRPRAAKPAVQAGAEAQAPVEGKAAQAPKPPKQAKKAQPAPAAEAAKKQAARQPRQAKAQQAPAPRGGRGGRPKMASPRQLPWPPPLRRSRGRPKRRGSPDTAKTRLPCTSSRWAAWARWART